MRKFILRVLGFGMIVIVLIGGACLAEILIDITRYHKALRAPEGTSILFCGDSQVGNAVNSDVCCDFFNYSAHGRTLDQSYLTMIDVLRHNPTGCVKSVVFDVTPAAATSSFQAPLSQMGQPAMYWLLHFLHPEENLRSLSGGLIVARDDLVDRRFHHLSRALRGKIPFRSSLEAQFPRFNIVGKKENPKLYWSLLRAKAACGKDLGRLTLESPFVVQVLDKIVSFARSNGIRCVFVTTPWHEDLREACGANKLDVFTDVMRKFAVSRHCDYLDFLAAPLDENC